MKFYYDCLQCHLNQGLKVSKALELSEEKTEVVMRRILRLMSEVSYNQSNPGIMAQTWKIISDVSKENDPYKAFKIRFNKTLLQMEEQIKSEIRKQNNWFYAHMYAAILGNIIDLGPGHDVDDANWLHQFKTEMKTPYLQADKSQKLQESLKSANKLLYIGDNCGEIVLDKLFIEFLQSIYPKLEITFCVREAPILNDVTLEDAKQVELDQMVKIMTTGGATPGVVMEQTSEAFREAFLSADVVIAKGQGNFEGLSALKDSRVYFLFMVKCQLLAGNLKVPLMSKMCWSYESNQ